MTTAPEPVKYDGFISYSAAADYQTARRVESFLEAIHRLTSPDLPVRRLQICRDGSDFKLPKARRDPQSGSHDPIWQIIHSQLSAARYLLVLCSPAAVKSRWVEQEVRWFIENRGADVILPLVTEGSDPLGNPHECFPEPLIAAGLHETRIWYDLRGQGARAPIPGVKDYEDELVRVASDLLDWDSGGFGQLSTLWHRERLRTRRRAATIAGVVAVVLMVLASGAIYQAVQARYQAARARTAALVNIASMQRDPATAALILSEVASLGGSTAPYGATSVAVRVATSVRPLAILLGHTAAVTSVAFSAPGDKLLTASQDGTARIWPVESGGAPVVFQGAGTGFVEAVFSHDGRRIATAGLDGSVHIWPADDPASPRVLTGHEGPVRSLQFSADDRWIVTASDDRTARLWSAADGSTVNVLRAHEGVVRSAVFSHHGDLVLTASDDGTVGVWRADGTMRPERFGFGGGLMFSSALFSPNDDLIIASSSEGTGWIFDLKKRVPFMTLPGAAAPIFSTAFSNDGRWIIAAQNESVRLWDVERLSPFGQRNEPHRTLNAINPVRKAIFSQDSTHVAAATEDGSARVWPIEEGDEAIVLGAHDGPVLDIAFSPDGKRLATASADGTVRIWQVARASEPMAADIHRGPIGSAQFAADGQRAVTMTRDGRVRVWRRDGEMFVNAGGDESLVRFAAINVDGTHVVTVAADGELAIWNVDRDEHLSVSAADPATRLAAVDRDGRRVVAVVGERGVRVWRVPERTQADFPAPGARVNSVRFSPDGTAIVAALQDGSVVVWRSDTPAQPLVFRGHQQAATDASFSADGRYVASVGEDATARVWDISGATPMRMFAHAGAVFGAAFSTDGKRLVTGSVGGGRVWTLDASDAPIDLVMPDAYVWTVAFTSDGTETLAAASDGRLWIWHTDWRQLVGVHKTMRSCLTAEQRVRLLGEATDDADAKYRACAARPQMDHR